MKALRVAVFTTLVVTAVLVLQGAQIAPALSSTTQQQRGVEVELRRQLQMANRELASLQERRLQEQLPPAAVEPQAATLAVEPRQSATVDAQRWDDTPDHRRLYELLKRVANPRREVMVGLVNDVMMCTNRKTCWWGGGNILETFLTALKRIALKNYAMVTLDDETEAFCQRFGGVPSLRMALPVPTAQQGSRGANMISTLKYGLLRQTLLMGFSVLVVDLDIIFLKDPFAHLYRDADVEGSTDGFTAAWASGAINSVRAPHLGRAAAATLCTPGCNPVYSRLRPYVLQTATLCTQVHEPKMGWGAGGLYVQYFTMNVGCAFIRPTPASINARRCPRGSCHRAPCA